MMRYWPQSLSGRLAIILVGGMLAAQALTGTIWYDMRYGKAMEIPSRLAATRLADAMRLLDQSAPPLRATLLPALSGPGMQLQGIVNPERRLPRLDANQADAARLFQQVLRERDARVPKVREVREVRMLSVAVADGDNGSLATMLLEPYPTARFVVQVNLSDGAWLQAEIHEGQAGMSMTPLAALRDYLLRIYLLRATAIVLLAWLAVRLVMQPLKRLADAAEQLGNNIHSQPLATDGPLEVRKASLAFNAMQQRLIDNIAERTRFIAAVSHDLRSPITRLRLRAELAVAPAQRERFCKDLDEMDALIDATLHLVQDSDVQEQPQLVDIDSLLTSLRVDFSEIGAEVRVDGHAAPLPGYAQSLRRCLYNLIENAIRYGQVAMVEVRDTRDALRIAVRDQGPGIPQDQLAKVLEPFYRLEPSRNAGTGGFGLGLNIAQTVARAHHGELRLRNLPERGLEVLLLLYKTRSN